MNATDTLTPPREKELINEVLEGDESSIALFSSYYKPILARTLAARADTLCARQGITEVLDQLIAECVAPLRETKRGTGGPRSLLVSYQNPKKGGEPGPFLAWLRFVANNRFNDWVREHGRIAPLDFDTEDESPEAVSVDGDEARLAGEALKYGFAQAVEARPLGVLSLLLSAVHNIQGQRIARAFGITGGNVTRARDRAGDIIRRETLGYLRRADPWLELDWNDVLHLLGSDFLGAMMTSGAKSPPEIRQVPSAQH